MSLFFPCTFLEESAKLEIGVPTIRINLPRIQSTSPPMTMRVSPSFVRTTLHHCTFVLTSPPHPKGAPVGGDPFCRVGVSEVQYDSKAYPKYDWRICLGSISFLQDSKHQDNSVRQQDSLLLQARLGEMFFKVQCSIHKHDIQIPPFPLFIWRC